MALHPLAMSLTAAVDSALKLHRSGRTHEAWEAYGAILAHDPRQPDALHGIGVIHAQNGDLDQARKFVERAVGVRPAVAAYRNSLGNILQQRGAFAEAEAAFRKAIELDPHLAQARANLGHVMRATGRHDEAIASFRSALAQDAKLLSAWAGLGQSQLALRDAPGAIASFEAALALKPGDPRTRFLLGSALLDAGEFARAESELRSCVAALRAPEAWCNLGRAVIAQERWRDAFAPLDEALRLKPEMPEAHFNRSLASFALDDLHDAIASLERTVAADPNWPDAWRRMGDARLELCDTAGARAAYDRAIGVAPGDAEARGKRALALLTDGEMPQGWYEYEWRWKCEGYRPRPERALPRWDGGAVDGRLLLDAEQGFGDLIQFARFAPMLARRGHRVVLECWTELRRLFERIEGVEVVTQHDALPPVAAHCALMSVPARLGLTQDAIPAEVPYLSPDPADVRRWEERLAPFGARTRIGLVWAGNPRRYNDRIRSLTFDYVAPLVERHDAVWVGLQHGAAAKAATGNVRLLDWSADFTDFAATAALIGTLDLVVATDTAVAHLAGALGKPVWILLPVGDVWRWMLRRDDSPWYPTARLFRQTVRGDWRPVVAAVDAALTGFLGASARSAPVRSD